MTILNGYIDIKILRKLLNLYSSSILEDAYNLKASPFRAGRRSESQYLNVWEYDFIYISLPELERGLG